LRHASVGVVVALLALWAGPGAVAAPMSERMVDQINQTREQASLPPLERAPALERSAGAFARWLLDHNTLTHRPAVSTNRAYPHRGEALSMHFSLQARIGPTLKAWLGSPTHRGLVMTTSMDMIGVGHARGRVQGRPRTVWVVQVARD
jgi:uncharacterized protein YkwD